MFKKVPMTKRCSFETTEISCSKFAQNLTMMREKTTTKRPDFSRKILEEVVLEVNNRTLQEIPNLVKLPERVMQNKHLRRKSKSC